MPLALAPLESFHDDSFAPAAEELAAAQHLIRAESDPHATGSLHPSLKSAPQPKYSELIDAEHARIASGVPKDGGLDLSRYELLDAPDQGDLVAWRAALQKAYASAEYLRGRQTNLSLLEAYGKNAWLISNSQLEDQLRYLEREIESAKLEQEQVEQARQANQGNSLGEMRSLETAWKTGMGSMLATQAAAERLRLDILDQKRQRAG